MGPFWMPIDSVTLAVLRNLAAFVVAPVASQDAVIRLHCTTFGSLSDSMMVRVTIGAYQADLQLAQPLGRPALSRCRPPRWLKPELGFPDQLAQRPQPFRPQDWLLKR